MALEDVSTRAGFDEGFQELDDECKAIWAELGDDMDDETRYSLFNGDGRVHDMIMQMRRIRKRAAGRADRRVACDDELVSSLEEADSGSSAGVVPDL